MLSPVTDVIIPSTSESNICPLSLATRASMPVPTKGASGVSNGTACLCILDPIRARLASSCSKNGINDVDTLTICIGETSIYSTCAGGSIENVSPRRVSIWSVAN